MKLKIIYFLLAYGAAQAVIGQELKGGEISFERLGIYTYQIDFELYYFDAELLEKPFLLVEFNGIPDTAHLETETGLNNGITLLRYGTVHTFSGPSNNIVTVVDTLYLPELENLGGVNKNRLLLFSVLEISPSYIENTPPVFLNLQTDYEISDGIFQYSLKCSDIDGDFLFYFVKDFSEYPGYEYQFPDTPDSYGLNSISGEVFWDRPTEPGKYLLGFDVGEYTSLGVFLGKRERIMVIEIKEEDIVSPTREMPQANFFHIYPNPAHQKITLSLPTPIFQKNIKIKAHDTLGHLVFEKETVGNGDMEIKVEDWPPGLYFLTLEMGGRAWTEKVVVH